jgi:hypothetical protein
VQGRVVVFAGTTPPLLGELPRQYYDGCASLAAFPNQGRKGRIEGTRELVFPGLPYIVVTRVKGLQSRSPVFITRHKTGLERSGHSLLYSHFLDVENKYAGN